MKKKILFATVFAVLALVISVSLIACNQSEPTPTVTPVPTYCCEPPKEGSPHYEAQQWLANEIVFTSDKEYEDPVYTVTMDAVFTNMYTGTTYTVPAFWNGGTEWIVRYALTEIGEWKYEVTCSDTENAGLNGLEGSVTCSAYTGDLDIYKHGFIKTETGKHYFMYADGTPFFYLGDTHWTLPMEQYDGYGKISEEVANEKGITSQFKYIMDYRANQGFTVIQSQQLSDYAGIRGNSWMGDYKGDIYTYGVNQTILEKFQTLDKYFQYIAELGLVHAHAQFSYPEELIEVYPKKIDDAKIEALCRYWVARYSAYPVMWTTTQEGDKNYYGFDGCTAENNPWKLVFQYIQKYDPYDHPSSCHQENVWTTTVDDSAFRSLEGYTFYAMQYSVGTGSGSNQAWDILKEYWNNEGSLPVVNYEGCYDLFWIGPRGARTQGWCAYLNGVFGHGYGVQPIWAIYWASGSTDESSRDGETYARNQTWLEGLESSGGYSMSYMKKFFEQYEWWNIQPCFDGNEYYRAYSDTYSVATINGNEVYIAYYYGSAKYTTFGYFTGMKKGNYEIKYYNPQTGEYDETMTSVVKITDGEYEVYGKPDNMDWVIVAKYVGN